MAAGNSFVDLIRDDTAADTATLLKQIVNAGIGAADAKQTLRNRVDEIFGRPDTRENQERITEFSFVIPQQTLAQFNRAIIVKNLEPLKDSHWKTEHGVNYGNTNERSWLVKEEDTAWKEVDIWRDNKVAAGREADCTEGNLGRIFADARRQARLANRGARAVEPTWVVLARTQPNDCSYEDRELRFKETDRRDKSQEWRDTDWNQNLANIKNLGEQLGYTEQHYKHVLSRFISWFAPDLTIVTQKLTATETARFLLRLNTPDTESEKIEKQKAKLSRKPGQPLRPVMAFLQELAAEIHRRETEPEKTNNIRHMMLLGLIRFTHGRLQEEIVAAIEHCKKEGKKISWQNLMERAITKETFYGAPTTELRFQNDDKQSLLYQSLYNVSAKPGFKPKYEPQYMPGKGSLPEAPLETGSEIEEEIRRTRFSEYGTGYPSTEEMIKEIRRRGDGGYIHKVAQEQEQPTQGAQGGSSGGAHKTNQTNSKQPQVDETMSMDISINDVTNQIGNLSMDDIADKVAETLERRQSSRQTKKPDWYGVSKTNNSTISDKKDGESNSKDKRKDRTSRKEKDSKDKRNSDKRDRSRQDNRSRDRRDSRPTSRNSSRDSSRSQSRDSRPRSTDRSSTDRSRSRDRSNDKKTRDDRRNRSRDRSNPNRSDRRQSNQTKTNYSSSGKDKSRRDSRQSSRRDSKRDYSKDKGSRGTNKDNKRRDNSRSRENSRDRYPTMQRGQNCSKTYDPADRFCDKCGSTDHHAFQCGAYDRWSYYICRRCNKGLRHWDADCRQPVSRESSRSNSRSGFTRDKSGYNEGNR